jgi:hypothetical protein
MYGALPATQAPNVGDLVFFGSGSDATHVGVCNTPGCTVMIDAPNSGSVVRFDSIPGAGGMWGTEQVLGYRSIPGLAGLAGSETTGSAKQHGGQSVESKIASAFGSLNPFNWGSDATKAIEGPIVDAIASIPSTMLETITGGHTPAELMVRTIEVVGGGIILLVGVYCFGKVVMAQTQTTGQFRAAGAVGKKGYKRTTGAAREVRTQRATVEDMEAQATADQERKENAGIAKRMRSSEYNDQAPRAKSYRRNVTGDEPF